MIWSGPNVSTTPLRQWGFRQCLPFSWTTQRGKFCRHPIAIMGVVDTFRPDVACNLCIFWKIIVSILTKNSIHLNGYVKEITFGYATAKFHLLLTGLTTELPCLTWLSHRKPKFSSRVLCLLCQQQSAPKPSWLIRTHTEPRLCL